MNNSRITRQDGAFLIFGIDGIKRRYATIPDQWVLENDAGDFDLRIFQDIKKSILT